MMRGGDVSSSSAAAAVVVVAWVVCLRQVMHRVLTSSAQGSSPAPPAATRTVARAGSQLFGRVRAESKHPGCRVGPGLRAWGNGGSVGQRPS